MSEQKDKIGFSEEDEEWDDEQQDSEDEQSEEEEEESNWNFLIDNIIAGNVVPVIGADLLVEYNKNVHKMVIDAIAKKKGVKSNPESFSDLIYDPNYLPNKSFLLKRNAIYTSVNNYMKGKRFPPSQQLIRLLSTWRFPFVITTSFTTVVEDVMRNIWGNVNVMIFDNDPQHNEDVKDESDLRNPSVYYMFGKVGERAYRFALTDTDMLDFVSSWLSDDKRPQNLCNALKGKYLLMLGTNYSNWLLRFIWYSIRELDKGNTMFAYDTLDDSLIRFLERTSAFTRQDTSDVIDQIIFRLDKRLSENERTKFYTTLFGADIFISYSRSDAKRAEELYNALTARGKNVWYDKYNIAEGANFKDEIKRSIRKAKFFVPLFSENIAKEKNYSHVYRTEWEVAIDVSISMGRTYIIPVAEEGFDFYEAAIPERIKEKNAIFVSPNETMDNVAERIISVMNKI